MCPMRPWSIVTYGLQPSACGWAVEASARVYSTVMRKDLHVRATFLSVRTTVKFDDDVAAAIEQVRREHRLGVSDAVNELVRRGLASPAPPPGRFVQRTSDMGQRIDVTDVADALETLDGPAHR